MTLKEEFLALLEKDKEFRYAVAGLLGFEEILRRLDKHEEELVKLREDLNRLGGNMLLGFKRHDEELVKLREEMNKLREDMNKLREDMLRGFELMNRHLDALGARWG
jgi:predicted translin family RNA/ssDNA-binding protein